MAATPLEHSSFDLKDFKRGAPQNLHQKKRYKLIKDLIESVPKPGNCLDYGSGLGDVAFQVAGLFDSIVGVDPTAKRVDWANEEFAPVEFLVCDDTLNCLGNRRFDTVLSSVVINWADDPMQYLANAHQVLVPGGHLIIIVRAVNKCRYFFRKLLGKPAVTFKEFKEMDVATINGMLAESGFEVVHTDCFYESISENVGSVSGVAMEIIKMPMRLLKLPDYSAYFGIVARKPG